MWIRMGPCRFALVSEQGNYWALSSDKDLIKIESSGIGGINLPPLIYVFKVLRIKGHEFTQIVIKVLLNFTRDYTFTPNTFYNSILEDKTTAQQQRVKLNRRLRILFEWPLELFILMKTFMKMKGMIRNKMAQIINVNLIFLNLIIKCRVARGLLRSRHLVVKITDFTDFHPILSVFGDIWATLGRYFTPKRPQEPPLIKWNISSATSFRQLSFDTFQKLETFIATGPTKAAAGVVH